MQKVPDARTYASVYLIVYEGPVSPKYSHLLTRAIMQALGPHVGARWSKVLTGVEFDTSAVDQEIDRSGAQGVLTLRPIGQRTGRQGEIVEFSYGATFHDRQSNQPLWAAKVDITGEVGVGIQELADKIVGALANDHLIPPAVVALRPTAPAAPAAHLGAGRDGYLP